MVKAPDRLCDHHSFLAHADTPPTGRDSAAGELPLRCLVLLRHEVNSAGPPGRFRRSWRGPWRAAMRFSADVGAGGVFAACVSGRDEPLGCGAVRQRRHNETHCD